MTRITRHSVFRYGTASLVPRTAAIVTAAIVTPLGLSKLGPTEYGYWVLAVQIPSLLASPDLGLGQGAINELAATHRADGNLQAARRRLHGLVKLLAVIAATWFVVGSVVVTSYVLGSHQGGGTDRLMLAMLAALACFTASIPATVWPRAQLAQERGATAVLWDGVGKVSGLVACVAVLVFVPDVTLLVIAFVLPTTIALWLNAWIYQRSNGLLVASGDRPRLREAFRENRHVFSVGKYFVVLQLCYLITTASDPYLVNAFLSADDVTYLNVLRRPFDVLPLFVSMFAVALWPVFARLTTPGDEPRLRRLVAGVTALSGLTVAGIGSVFVVLSGPIYRYLGQGFVDPPVIDLIWSTVYVTGTSTVMVVSIYLAAVGAVRAQTFVVVSAALLIMGSKVAALHSGDIHRFVAVAAVAYLLLTATPMLGLVTFLSRGPGRQRAEVARTADQDVTM